MDVSNGIATLGVNITQTGVDPTAQSLDRLAVSADKAEGSTKRLTETNDGLTVSQRAVLAMTDQQRQAYEKFLGVSTATAQSLQVVTNRYQESRAIVLAHAEALEIDAGAAGAHTLQLGRLNMELGTFIGRLTGANTAATRFAAMLGGSVAGYGQMIGVLIAIGGTLWVWDRLTNGTHEARKAQEELTKALEKWYEAERRGIAGERLQQLDAEIAKVQDLTKKYVQAAAARDMSGAGGNEGAIEFSRVQGNRADQFKAEIDRLNTIIGVGEDNVNKTLGKAIDQRATQYVNDLAHLVRYGAATADEQRKALFLINDFHAQLAGAGKNAIPALRNQLIEWVHALEDAEKAAGKVTIAPADPKMTNPIILGLEKQLTEMRKVNEEENVANVQREREIQLVGMVGYAKDVLLAQSRAELDTLKAYHDYVGVALKDRLATIQADKDADLAKAKLLRTRQEEIDTIKMFDDIVKDVTKIGKRNEAADKADINAAAKKIKDAQAYQDEMEKIARNGIERIVSHGMKSYQDFFGDILKTFSQLMDAMEREAKKHNTTPGGGFKALGIASAGIGGALAGYDIGHSTGSAVLGAAGGALSGFELGNAILPGIGGVVGALAGFAGGLFGASRAAKEAAAALDQLKQLQLQQTLAAWKASITGLASDQRLANELDLKYKYLSIRQTIEQVEAGKKNEEQRNKDLAEADALYKQAQAKLTDSTNTLTDSMLNAVAGYKYQAAIFAAAGVHAAPGAPMPSAPPTPPPSSGGGAGYSGGGQTTDGALTVKVVLGDGAVLGTAVLKDFKRRAQGKFGSTTKWNQIQ